jgi:hypothetical protein
MELATFKCLYCGTDKPAAEASLEHAVPQFMGGAYAPAQYMLRNVCESCNNKLGLFVDASYAKSWFVTNGMAMAAWGLYSDLKDNPVPMSCMGTLVIDGLHMPQDQTPEYWIGPSGETVVWIRSHDERIYWYSGGNPIDKKKKPSTAYLFLTSADPTRWKIGMSSFQEAFKGKKVRRILCAQLVGAPAGTALPGFDAPTEEEEANIVAIRNAMTSGWLSAQTRINVNFDVRFISKLALAIGYSLFGDAYLSTSLAQEARKGCWPKEDDMPQVRGSSSLAHPGDPKFAQIVGYPGAVALMVMRSDSWYALTVTIDQRVPFIVQLAPTTLTSRWFDPESGYVLLLFPQLRKMLEISLIDMVVHITGIKHHPGLEEIDAKRRDANAFHVQLGPIGPPANSAAAVTPRTEGSSAT